MRPNSVIMFERLYLASLAAVLIQQVASYLVARDLIGRMPAGADFPGTNGFMSGMMIGSMVFGILLAVGIPLLLWWLAAKKRVEVAKWLLLAVSVLSVLMWLFSLVVMLIMPMPEMGAFANFRSMQLLLVAIDGVGEALGIAALVFLFRRDATEWFRTAAPNMNADVFR
jgi:hypothetical protein